MVSFLKGGRKKLFLKKRIIFCIYKNCCAKKNPYLEQWYVANSKNFRCFNAIYCYSSATYRWRFFFPEIFLYLMKFFFTVKKKKIIFSIIFNLFSLFKISLYIKGNRSTDVYYYFPKKKGLVRQPPQQWGSFVYRTLSSFFSGSIV